MESVETWGWKRLGAITQTGQALACDNLVGLTVGEGTRNHEQLRSRQLQF